MQKNSSDAVVDRKTERGVWTTLDGCPITPGPWFVRAATFCDDGIPSFEVVMPGEPRMSAPDARVIGAAPSLYVALKNLLACKWVSGTTSVQVEAARTALALVNLPESAKRPISDDQQHGPAS